MFHEDRSAYICGGTGVDRRKRKIDSRVATEIVGRGPAETQARCEKTGVTTAGRRNTKGRPLWCPDLKMRLWRC